MATKLRKPPAWASESHIGNGRTHYCHHCLKHDRGTHELEVEDTQRIATWMGANHEDGFEEKVRCPNCDRRGQIKTKLMDEFREQTRLVQLGSAAPIQEAQSEPTA